MSLLPASSTEVVRHASRHGVARWWLAGLLVSCLLPVSLAPVGALPGAERSGYVTFFVPAVLRAQSRRIAWVRRVYQRWLGRGLPTSQAHSKLRRGGSVMMVWLVAAQDVFTRRGPPPARG